MANTESQSSATVSSDSLSSTIVLCRTNSLGSSMTGVSGSSLPFAIYSKPLPFLNCPCRTLSMVLLVFSLSSLLILELNHDSNSVTPGSVGAEVEAVEDTLDTLALLNLAEELTLPGSPWLRADEIERNASVEGKVELHNRTINAALIFVIVAVVIVGS